MSEITEFRIYSRTEKPVSRVHGPWTTGTSVHRGPTTIATLGSSASGRSGARELRPTGGREGGRAGEPNGGVVVAQEAMEGRLTGDGNLGSEGRRRGCGEG
jgi:hypothetical protein